jgi:hypothetical protein
MSAAAQITDVRPVAPELRLAEATHTTLAEMQVKEMNRWMLWFGVPVLVMAISMGATFVTGSVWGIGGVLAALIADIGILIWLCMSSDTNGTDAPEFAAPAH